MFRPLSDVTVNNVKTICCKQCDHHVMEKILTETQYLQYRGVNSGVVLEKSRQKITTG